jgi:hypothetical protein
LLVRSFQDRSPDTTAPPRTLWLLLLFLLAALGFWRTHHGHVLGMWAEDVPIYVAAMSDFLAGRNPYNLSHAPMYFFYPPFFLEFTAFLSRFVPSGWGARAYMLLDGLATFALPLVLARFYFPRRWLTPLFALLLFFVSPRYTGVLGLFGMNVASTMYCLAFVAAVPGLKRNRWEWFYFAVLFAAMIKITFLALLLLPLLAGRRQWLRCIGCGAVVIAANLSERAVWPKLYQGYQWCLQQGILVNHSYGYGVFGIAATYLPHHGKGVGVVPYAISGLLSMTLLVLMFALRWKLDRSGQSAEWQSQTQDGRWGVWLALVLMTVILVNPRQMQYDVDIALFAAFVVWVAVLRTKRPLLLMVALFLPSVVARKVIAIPAMYGMYETLLLLVTFALGYWLVRRWAVLRAGVEEASSETEATFV